MSARAVAVIRPAPSIISLPAFLYILSGKRQLHALLGTYRLMTESRPNRTLVHSDAAHPLLAFLRAAA